MVSFQTGFSVDRIVLVFFLTLSESGISFIFTYGSLKPFGSMGIKLRPCFTGITGNGYTILFPSVLQKKQH